MNKHSKKKYRKQLIEDYMRKKNDDGYRYGNCPMCFNKTKELIQSVYNNDDGYWHCDKCKEKWTVVA